VVQYLQERGGVWRRGMGEGYEGGGF